MTESLLEPGGAPAAPADPSPPLETACEPPSDPAPGPGSEPLEIDCSHGLFEPDPELNDRLLQSGFTADQVRMVYDLAAERMMPMLEEMAADLSAERELDRLTREFGGEERFRETAGQMLAWGRRNLPAAALEALSSSFEGVMALHALMQAGVPPSLAGSGRGGVGGGVGGEEAELQRLMRTPAYWRDRDPATVARVTEGFRRLYPDAD